MTPWDLSETYTLVERAFGKTQAELVRPCLRSIVDRQNFARYHYEEARRLLKTFQRKQLADKNLLIALHGPNNAKAREAFEILMIKAGAHVTACVQAVHAIPDILANGVYFAIGLNLGPSKISDRDVSITSVKNLALKTPSLAKLAASLALVAQGDQYRHLAAISNVSKHRTVVRASLNEDWTGKRKALHEFRFATFSTPVNAGEKVFPEIAFEELMQAEYDRISLRILEVGREVNRMLAAKSVKTPRAKSTSARKKAPT